MACCVLNSTGDLVTMTIDDGARLAVEPCAAENYRRAVELTAKFFDVSPIDQRWSRKARVPPTMELARRTALYLAVVGHNHSLRTIADVSNLSHEAVRKALHAVEDWRDDEAFDQKLERLERELGHDDDRTKTTGPDAERCQVLA